MKLDGIDLIRELGTGGMGTVYLGYDPHLDRHVAVKVLRAELSRDPAHRERFLQEGKAAARLKHPNIVPVFSMRETTGESTPRLYIVMEYVAGGSLRDALSRGVKSWREVVRIAIDTAAALEHAHRLRLIHGDVKPSNILVHEEGRYVLSDFGLARSFQDRDSRWGSKAYCSPHRLLGKRSAVTRDDLYALGVVLYESLTGRPPVPAEQSPVWPSPTRVIQELSGLSGGVPGELARLVAELLSEPGEKESLAEAEEVRRRAEAIERQAYGQVYMETGPLDARDREGQGRFSKAWWALPLLLWLCVLFFSWGTVFQANESPPTRTFAPEDESAEEGPSLEKKESLQRAFTLEERGLLDEAALAAERAVKSAPGDPVVLYHWGRLLNRLGHHEQALEPLRQSLANAPTFRRILWRSSSEFQVSAVAVDGGWVAWLFQGPQSSWVEWTGERDSRRVRLWETDKGVLPIDRRTPRDAAVLKADSSRLLGCTLDGEWSRTFPGRTLRSVAHIEDRVLVDFQEGGGAALRAKDGRIRRLLPGPSLESSGGLLQERTELFQYEGERYSVRFSPDPEPFIECGDISNQGQFLWRASTPRLDASVGFLVIQGSVVWCDREGRLTALSLDTGQVLWNVDLSSRCRSLLAGPSVVLATDEAGNRLAVQPQPWQGKVEATLEGNILLSTGQALKGMGQLEEAVKTFRALVEDVEPSFARGHMELAKSMNALGRMTQAEEEALLAARYDVPGKDTWMEASSFLSALGNGIRLGRAKAWKGGDAACSFVDGGDLLLAGKGHVWLLAFDSVHAEPIWTGQGERVSSVPHGGVSFMTELFLHSEGDGPTRLTMPHPISCFLPGPSPICGLEARNQSLLVASRKDTGGFLWSADVEGSVLAVHRVAEGQVLAETLFSNGAVTLYWVSSKDGSVLEQRSIASGGCVNCFEEQGFVRILCGKDPGASGSLRAYSALDGTQLWYLDLSPARVVDLQGDVDTGRCLVMIQAERSCRCMALDAREGLAEWVSEELPPGETRFLGTAGKSVWVGCGRRALALDRSTGELGRTIPLPAAPTACRVHNDALAVVTRRGEILRGAFD